MANEPKEQRNAGGGTPGAEPKKVFHPPTLTQKIVVALWLIALMVGIVALWKVSVEEVEHHLRNETRVPWATPSSVVPKPGPPNFWYDPEHKQLVFVGAVDAKQKFELIALLPADAAENSPDAVTTYQSAIDALAFKSNQGLLGVAVALLCLGGLSGAMGAQLRSFTSFVGNACYTERLDITTWWPYYLLRPFTGFILGIVVVVIVQAGFLSVGNGQPSGTLWWVAIAILAGYSDDEFTQKLRQISKAVFGEKDAATKKPDLSDGEEDGTDRSIGGPDGNTPDGTAVAVSGGAAGASSPSGETAGGTAPDITGNVASDTLEGTHATSQS